MSLFPPDIQSPSGSLPPSPERTSDLLGRLRGTDVVKKAGPNATDLKILRCYLSLRSFETPEDQDNLSKIANWIVDNKEALTSAKKLDEDDVINLSEIVSSLVTLKQSQRNFQVKDTLVNSLYEIVSKYIEIETSIKGNIHKISLIDDLEKLGSDINKGKKPIQYLRLILKVSSQCGITFSI